MPAKRRRARIPKASFHSVALVVSDRQKSVEWYLRNLGLDVIEQGMGDDEHWVVVGRRGLKGGIHLCDIPTFDPAFSGRARRIWYPARPTGRLQALLRGAEGEWRSVPHAPDEATVGMVCKGRRPGWKRNPTQSQVTTKWA